MSTITLEEAQARLPELIAGLKPGEEVVITQEAQPVARLVAERPAARKPRVPGTARGKILYMADDFNAPLEDFKEYME
jgi:antitoxin (DNA-binding transcriptional repressor) of toxin-antitoxin stability system